MTTFTRVTDDVDDNLASYHNELIDGIQAIPGPDAWLENGYFTATVVSNNLSVAIVTIGGGEPSATNPVTLHIGTSGTTRQITAALSVTKNAGTNWFNSGSTELQTVAVGYFVYLIWNTTPATDIMDIGFARIPGGRVYSDFSATTTNEKYLAQANASAPTSTDDCVNIGYFEATLSAGAGYTWSISLTNSNCIQGSTSDTRWLSWNPVFTGFSANPTSVVHRYRLVKNTLMMLIRHGANGTSNATTFTLTAPFTAANITNAQWSAAATADDNGASLTTPALLVINLNQNTINVYKDWSVTGGGAAWTGSAGKRVRNGLLICEI